MKDSPHAEGPRYETDEEIWALFEGNMREEYGDLTIEELEEEAEGALKEAGWVSCEN